MNGISTLQWKHTFFSSPNSNYKFYPIFSDFFKEIQIISLDSLSCKNEVFAQRSCRSFAVGASLSELRCRSFAPYRNYVPALPKLCSGLTVTMFRPYQNYVSALTVTKRSFVWRYQNLVLVTGKELRCAKTSFLFLQDTEIMKSNLKRKTNSNQSKVALFFKKGGLKSFYYQLKYKTRFNTFF